MMNAIFVALCPFAIPITGVAGMAAAAHQELSEPALDEEVQRQVNISGGWQFLQIGKLHDALAAFQLNLANGRRDPVSAYGAACCLVKQGHDEEGMKLLQDVRAWGYEGLDDMMQWEPTLHHLKELGQIQSLGGEVDAEERTAETSPNAGPDQASVQLEGGLMVRGVACHPLQPFAAVAFGANGVRVIDLQTGRTKATWPADIAWTIPPCYSPDGDLLVTVRPSGTIDVWRADSGVHVAILEPKVSPGQPPTVQVEFNDLGTQLLAYGTRVCPTTWRRSDWQCSWEQEGWAGAEVVGSWSPCGTKVALAEATGTAWVCGIEPGAPKAGPFTNPKSVSDLLLSPNGERLVVAGYSGWVRVFSLATGELDYEYVVTDMFGESWALQVAFSADDSTLFTSTSSGYVWARNAASGNVLWRSDTIGGNPFSSPIQVFCGGEYLVVTGNGSNIARVINTDSGEVIARYLHEPPRNLDVACGKRLVVSAQVSNLVVSDVLTGQVKFFFVALPDGGELVLARNGAYDCTPGGDRRVGVVVGGEDEARVSIRDLPEYSFDPRRLAASL